MPKKSYRQAINEAIRQEMERDPRVIMMGEDVAGGAGAPGEQDAWGGPLGVTKGLMPKFGRERVLDTPISELAFIGAAIGAAATGLRPIADLMFVDFMGVCFDQIFNQAAKFRYMFGGKAVTPVVIRTMYGAGFRAASQHSQCLYPLFTHIPGLKVVLPSNPYEAKGLMIQAIRDDDPVIFFEHKTMYDVEADVPDEPYAIPLRRGQRDPRGAGRHDHHHRADGQLRQRGGRQPRQERRRRDGSRPSHDLAARSSKRCWRPRGRPVAWWWWTRRIRAARSPPTSRRWWRSKPSASLKAPIKMVTSPHAPVPFSPALEDLYIPSVAKIEAAVREVIGLFARQGGRVTPSRARPRD